MEGGWVAPSPATASCDLLGAFAKARRKPVAAPPQGRGRGEENPRVKWRRWLHAEQKPCNRRKAIAKAKDTREPSRGPSGTEMGRSTSHL